MLDVEPDCRPTGRAGDVDARAGADRRRAAASAPLRRVPAPAREDDPAHRCGRSASWPPPPAAAGCWPLADLIAQPMPGPLGELLRRRLRGSDANESTTRRPCRRRPRRGPRGTPSIGRPPPLRLHDAAPRGRQDDPPGRRLHVQRRRDGAVLGHAAALPAEARLPSRRAADRDGAGQRAHRRRGGHLPEPGVGRCSPTWPPTSPIRRSRLARVQASMDGAKTQLQGDPGRDAAGLHPVRPAGDRRPGDADVQPAAHRRPDGAAVQPDDLQRARPGAPALLGRRPS